MLFFLTFGCFPRSWSQNKFCLLKYVKIAKTVDLDNKYKMKIK